MSDLIFFAGNFVSSFRSVMEMKEETKKRLAGVRAGSQMYGPERENAKGDKNKTNIYGILFVLVCFLCCAGIVGVQSTPSPSFVWERVQ